MKGITKYEHYYEHTLGLQIAFPIILFNCTLNVLSHGNTVLGHSLSVGCHVMGRVLQTSL